MIEIRWDADWKGLINQKQLEEILKVFLNKLFKNERDVSLYLTNDAEIQKLNQQFAKCVLQIYASIYSQHIQSSL